MNSNNQDIIFITVGSIQQKQLCEKLVLDLALKLNLNIRVLSDEEYGCRLGSGGALLRVADEYYCGKKILLINSGGQSKRSINYAVRGKAFCNILSDGIVTTLLENIIINAQKILAGLHSGILVCCSDILVNADEITIPQNSCFGICSRTDLKTGSRHGVMFTDGSGTLDSFMHKKDETILRLSCKEEENSTVLTDTGVVYFNDEYCRTLKDMCKKEKVLCKLVENKLEINLYSDLLVLFQKNTNEYEYTKDDDSVDALFNIKRSLFKFLSVFQLKVVELKDQRFVHFGSLKESVKNIILLSGVTDGYINMNSIVDNESTIGNNTVLDNVEIEGPCKIGFGSFISDITLNSVVVGDNLVVCGIKLIEGDYVTIICDIDENPKNLVVDTELWRIPRFFKGNSYTESLIKFYNNQDEPRYSLEYCVAHADYDYYNKRCKYLNDKKSQRLNKEYLKYRRNVIENYKSNNGEIRILECKHDRIELDLPVRVNFSGTWTDAMPYCIDNGGGVVNAAVTVDGKTPIKVIIEKLNKNKIELCSDGVNAVFSFNDTDYEGLSDFVLHKAAIEAVGITSSTEILNGFRLTTHVTDIDNGSGLGTSSILLGGCFLAFVRMFGLEKSMSEILKMVFVAEQLMGTGGGWQDQVGGLLPAVKLGYAKSGLEQNIETDNITCSEKFIKMFSDRAVLVPTGQRHFGRFIVNDVVNRYLDKIPESLLAHSEIVKLNRIIIKSIEDGDCEIFCNCLNLHRSLLKKISPLVSNANIDLMVEKCLKMADAVSFCGAGGGGYLLTVLKDGVSVDDFKLYFSQEYPLIKSKIKKIDIYF